MCDFFRLPFGADGCFQVTMKHPPQLTRRTFVSTAALASLAAVSGAQPAPADENPRLFPLDDPDKLILKGCKATIVDHRGRRAVELTGLPGNRPDRGQLMAVIPDLLFKNGTIQVELAGAPLSQLVPGFIGLAFHIQDGGKRFENVYLRPRNARSENQLQRNHSCQYASEPDFDWKKLRDESPGVYESYVDLEVDAWTQMKLDIHGKRLRLFVNDATQPCLVVNDLKLGEVSGAVALWPGGATRSFFRNLRVTSSMT